MSNGLEIVVFVFLRNALVDLGAHGEAEAGLTRQVLVGSDFRCHEPAARTKRPAVAGAGEGTARQSIDAAAEERERRLRLVRAL